MFAWLAGKQKARTKALERYLSNFNSGELAYLKNITLTGLSPYESAPDDPFINVDLSTYLHAEWMAANREIPNNPVAKARLRARYRIELARDATIARMRSNLDTYFTRVLKHRLDQPDLDEDAEERLGAHWIVLTRIYKNPTQAPTLPELEEIGEGRDWLPE